MAERFARLAAGGGGEGFDDGDARLVLAVLADPHRLQSGERGRGGAGIAAQRGQPAPVAGQVFAVSQTVGVNRLGQGVIGGVPVAEQQQRLDQVLGRGGQQSR